MTASNNFFKKTVKPEVIPMFVAVGGIYGAAGWYLTRLARRPDVVWNNRSNPYPWQDIDQKTRVNFMSNNKDLDKKYTRERL